VLVRQVLGAFISSRRHRWSPSSRRRETARKRPRASAVGANHTPRPDPRSCR
jgi:hypothetical protein